MNDENLPVKKYPPSVLERLQAELDAQPVEVSLEQPPGTKLLDILYFFLRNQWVVVERQGRKIVAIQFDHHSRWLEVTQKCSNVEHVPGTTCHCASLSMRSRVVEASDVLLAVSRLEGFTEVEQKWLELRLYEFC